MANPHPQSNKGKKIKRKYTVGDICQALDNARGGVYMAARELRCSHQTIYNYIKEHPKIKETIDSHRGYMIDKSEYNVYERVEEGDIGSSYYVLNKLGKERGYTKQSTINLNVEDRRSETEEQAKILIRQTRERLLTNGYMNGTIHADNGTAHS